jgi:uncharacterized protein
MKKIAIAGANGIIGKALINVFRNSGYEILLISRNKKSISDGIETITWDDNISGSIDNCSTLINLAGASIAEKRWTPEYKSLILNSRVIATEVLVHAISKCENPPKLINASAIGFYGNRFNENLNEESLKGNGFLSDVCYEWEKAAGKAEAFTDLAICRIGIVLDKNGGALQKMILPYKLFAGGKLGNGKQWMSWIHINDLADLFLKIAETKEACGVFNISSPQPVLMSEFAYNLGKSLNKPSIFTIPEFLLKTAMGEASQMILYSQKVIPKRTLDMGFIFNFCNLGIALNNIFKINNESN